MTIVVDVRGMDREQSGAALDRATVGETVHVHVRTDDGVYCPYDAPECAIGAEMTLTRDNADEVAAWCDGRRAGGANELVGLPYPDTRFARPGDTLLRTGETTYEIIAG
ncbi:MAG TPA: hypothetical protein VGE95_21565 [Arthrobacter sp.]